MNDPETWAKSNPLLLLPSEHDNLMSGLKQELDDKRLSGEEFRFANKNLNLWLDYKTNSYIDLDDWEATTSTTDFDIKGRDV
jgi:Phage terminase-like protein, large subunit